MLFAQDPPLSGQFAQQRKLRMMAQEAAAEAAANSKLRRLPEHNSPVSRTGVEMGHPALFTQRSIEKVRPVGVARHEFWALVRRQ